MIIKKITSFTEFIGPNGISVYTEEFKNKDVRSVSYSKIGVKGLVKVLLDMSEGDLNVNLRKFKFEFMTNTEKELFMKDMEEYAALFTPLNKEGAKKE